jgi:hypothetical protein
MSREPEATGLTLFIESPNADPEDLDRLTRQLRNELQDLDSVETAELVTSGQPAPGAKSGGLVAVGQIAVAVLPALLPKLVDFVQAWVLRGHDRTVRFEGHIAGQEVKFQGSAEEFRAMLASLQPKAADDGRP